jgi:hypothetical protein
MRRIVWTLILAPPLAAWLVLAVLTLSHVPRQVHSGDAFIDAYVQALVDRGGLPHSDTWLPETKWLELQRQFSNDPRFWWVCFKHRSGVLTDYRDPDVFLFEALHRSTVNLPILLSLYMSTSSSLEDKIRNNSNYPQYSSYSGPGALSKCIHARRALLDELNDNSAEDVLVKMQQCASRNPLSYYLQAMLAGEREQYDKALGLMKAGNTIAANEWYHDDLNFELYEPMVSKTMLSSDGLLADFLAERSDIDIDRLSFAFDEDAESLAIDALRLRRMDILNEIHKMGCYASITAGYDWEPTELGLSACKTVQKLVAQSSQAGDPSKSAALSRLLKMLNTTYNYWWSGETSSPQETRVQAILHAAKKGIFHQAEILIDSTSQGYYQPANRLLGIDPDETYGSYLYVRRKPGYQAELDKLFAELLRFDYTTCSFHDPPVLPAR